MEHDRSYRAPFPFTPAADQARHSLLSISFFVIPWRVIVLLSCRVDKTISHYTMAPLLRLSKAVPALLALASTATAASKPLYKNPKAPIEDRINDLLSRMTMEDKVGQIMQGDMANWMNQETGVFNATGLEVSMEYKRGAFYVGQPVDWDTLVLNIERGQKWLLENTTLGIPALIQTEGIHGFLIGNATIFNSPIGLGCSWDPPVSKLQCL